MNTFRIIDADCLRASRTIETILVDNSKATRVFYVYNYEGYSFRVFRSILSLINFFQEENESDFHFETESELDFFLANEELNK